MNRITTLLVFVVTSFAIVACGAERPSAQEAAHAPAHGKPGAPVALTAELSRSSARVTVSFEADVRDVSVSVRGVDGLVVTSAPVLVEGGAFTRGETRTFDVTFTPGPGRSHLVASVSATQNGTSRTRVSSFAVGTRTTARTSAATSEDEGGERVRLMRAADR